MLSCLTGSDGDNIERFSIKNSTLKLQSDSSLSSWKRRARSCETFSSQHKIQPNGRDTFACTFQCTYARYWDLKLHLFRRMTGQIILSLTYGIDPSSDQDRYLAKAEKCLLGLNEAAKPGAFLGEPVCLVFQYFF